MENNFFQQLKIFFQKFPGIGPRQAGRFIYTLVDFSKEDKKKMGELISSLNQYLKRCESCFRIFSVGEVENKLCGFCLGIGNRDHSKIMIVEKDSDLFNIEKTKLYNGSYFVLGKLFDPLEESGIKERIDFLKNRIQKGGRTEIILALSPSKQGEFTCEYIKKIMGEKNLISRLARGLSSGTDLEYADENTLRHAFENRK